MSITRLRGFLASLLILGALASPVQAAGIAVTVHQVDTSQFPKVRVYVSVASDRGIPIIDLEQDPKSFQLLEDDKPVTDFQVTPITASQEPIAVVLTMDVSGSMNDEGKMAAAKQAAIAFVDTMAPKDTVAIVSFANEVNIVQGFTGDKAVLKAAIDKLQANGATLLYDAVAQSAQLVGAVPQQRKVILLVSDGEDETSKKTNLDGAIAAAKAAGAPVFAVGFGKGVKRDVLDKLGGSTAGQAVYVTAPDQLKPVFLSLGDQLRRQYLLEYTTKLPGDDKPHNVTVKVQYRGEAAEAKGTLTVKRAPLALDVKGIADASRVSGTPKVEVGATGGTVQQVDLLVDDQLRGSATAAPFVIPWDTTKEKPGLHTVVIRAKDASGALTEKRYVVEVVGAAAAVTPTAAQAPTPPPPTQAPARSPVGATPLATPTKAGGETGTSPLLYAGAGLLALALIGGAVGAFVLLRRRRPAVIPAKPAVQPARRDTSDETKTLYPQGRGQGQGKGQPQGDVDGTQIEGGTMIVAPQRPRAKLHIVQDGSEQEVVLDQAETTLGREATCQIVVKDPLASRRHAKIVLEGEEFWIEDLKSLNHTTVNGEAITRRKLASSDKIKIGETTLTFVADQS